MSQAFSPSHEPQEDVANTYMDPECNPAGSLLVEQLTHNSPASKLRDAWKTTILPDVFSMKKGYFVMEEAYVEAQIFYLKVFDITAGRPTLFLVVEITSPSYSIPVNGKTEAEEQRPSYMRIFSGSPGTNRDKFWWAVCKGKDVQFHKVELNNETKLTPLHTELLQIDQHPSTITQFLKDIKTAASD